MSHLLTSFFLVLVATGAAAAAEPTWRTRRFALLLGSDEGGAGRATLRYARSDATSMGHVLTTLGGVLSEDHLLLGNPSPKEVRAAFSKLRAQVQSAAGNRVRRELVFYYSGHSDEQGLLLGDERLGYAELRMLLGGLPTDLQISVLDSCASGSFTRIKGGKLLAPFVVDSSTRTQGRVVLTSSSAEEASQESDAVGGSFFTHHLLSGLRGAADLSRDGRVTLNEAYHFAFQGTLARTATTQAGAQHPSYDIQMVGTGEVVMTDLRARGSTLVLAAPLDGRVFVRDSRERLVVEVEKQSSAPVELALDEAQYTVTVTRSGSHFRTQVTLPEGGRVVVEPESLTPVAGEVTASRGVATAPSISDGRWSMALLPGLGFGGSGVGFLPEATAKVRWKYFAVGVDASYMPSTDLLGSNGRYGAFAVVDGALAVGPVELYIGPGVGLTGQLAPWSLGPVLAFQVHMGVAVMLTPWVDVLAQGQLVLPTAALLGPTWFASAAIGPRFRL
ncbi:MAG: caspase domain-containing protein [Myxococcaceae bacterium]